MVSRDPLEVEFRYDADDANGLPPLAAIAGVGRLGAREEQTLEAVYFDTRTLALASRGITLRLRTGSPDAGWHLKLPFAAGQRQEISEPLDYDAASVPERLRQLVRVHSRGQELEPVARLKTSRTILPLHSPDGIVLAEFCDDRVDAQSLREPTGTLSWREWEIEPVDGGPRLLRAASAVVAASGHRPASSSSRLARALGAAYPHDPVPLPRPERGGPASAVFLTYMREQVEALKRHDPGVREDAPDAVHQLRVAARRMRSALSTFRELTDPGTAKQLRVELQWLATTVGEARDIEVMRTRLKEMISYEPPELLPGPVAQQLEEHFGASYGAARTAALAALNSERYFRLLDALDAFLAEPPLAGPARKKAPRTVGRLVSVERKRLQKAVRALDGDHNRAPTDAKLHDVRKRAKRLRYAAEAAEPLFGKPAVRLSRAAEIIQEMLGEHHDSVVTREALRALVAEAPAAGASGFSYGRLHALEQQRGDHAREEFFRTWRKALPRPLHWE